MSKSRKNMHARLDHVLANPKDRQGAQLFIDKVLKERGGTNPSTRSYKTHIFSGGPQVTWSTQQYLNHKWSREQASQPFGAWSPGTRYEFKQDGTIVVTDARILRARLDHVLTYSKDRDAALRLIDAVLTALTDPRFRREQPQGHESQRSDCPPVRDQYPLHPTAAELGSDWLRRSPDPSPSTSSPLLVRDEQGKLYRLTPVVEEDSK